MLSRLSFILGFILLSFFPLPASAQEFGAFTYPRTIGVDEHNNLLYVAEAFGGNLFVFDTSIPSTALIARYETQLDGPLKIIYDSSTNFTYVIYLRTREILIFNGDHIRQERTLGEVKRISFPREEWPNISLLNVIPASDGENIFVVQSGANPKIILARVMGDQLQSFALDRNPLSVAYDAAGKRLFVSYGVGFPVFTVISTETGKREEILTPYDAGQIAFQQQTNSLSVLSTFTPHLMVVHMESKEVREIKLPYQPYSLETDEAGNTYMTSYFFNSVLVLSAEAKLSVYPLSTYPIAMRAFGEKFVIVGHNGVVEVGDVTNKSKKISVETPARINIFGAYQLFPIIAVNRETSEAFIVNEDTDTITVLNISDGEVGTIGISQSKSTEANLSHPVSGAFWNDKLFVANFPGFVSVFEKDSERFLKKIFLPGTIHDLLLIDNMLYALSGSAKRVFIINPADGAIMREISIERLGGAKSPAGSLSFIRTDDNPHMLSIADQVSGDWLLLDLEEEHTVASGRSFGSARAGVALTNAVYVEGDAATGNIAVTSRSKGVKNQVLLPDDFKPLHFDVDQKTSDIIILGINTIGDARIFIADQGGKVKNHFPAGKSVSAKTARRTGFFTSSEWVTFAMFNNFTNSIWLFYPGRVDIYDKNGVAKDTILYSGGALFNLAFDKDRFFVSGIDLMEEIDLRTNILVRTLEYRDIPHAGVINRQVVLRTIVQKDQGIILIPMYNVISYFDDSKKTWHTFFQSDQQVLPTFIRYGINGDQRDYEKYVLLSIGFFALVLISFALFLYYYRRQHLSASE